MNYVILSPLPPARPAHLPLCRRKVCRVPAERAGANGSRWCVDRWCGLSGGMCARWEGDDDEGMDERRWGDPADLWGLSGCVADRAMSGG